MESSDNPSSKSQKPYGLQGIAQELYQNTLDHLVTLASQNGWKAYTWHKAKELENHPLGIYKGISQDLINRMKAINESVSDK